MATTAQRAAAPGVRAAQMLVGNDVANVLNLFRGDISMPVDLVAIAGRNGLDVSVTAFYSSDVHRTVSRWNRSDPTGVLGAGWSAPFDRIIVDQQGGATRLDDVYYLVTGGTPRPLVPVGTEGPVRVYQLRDHEYWQIRFYPDSARPEAERWEVVRTDGTTYVYGAGALQWGVRWGNWTGPSTVANGERYPVAWNLREAHALAGDTMAFEYETDEVPIGADGAATYTRACRLSRITDVFGQTVQFAYRPKDAAETPAPHVPPPGGHQAYQDRVEPNYLDHIEVRDAAGTPVSTTRLRYELRNVSTHPRDDAFVKRFLTGVRQENQEGMSLPELGFDYDDAGAVHPGALRSMLTPQGGRTSYTYSELPLPNTTLRRSVASPGAGWTPRVWHAARYTVITWVNAAAGSVTVDVHSWNGSWSAQRDTHAWAVAPGTLRVLTGDEFYAVWFQDAHTKQYRVQLFRSEPFTFGQWQRTPYEVVVAKPMTAPVVGIGGGFAAVADAAGGQLAVIDWDRVHRRWTPHLFGLSGAGHVALTAGLNFCVLATGPADGSSLTTTLYYADHDRRWQLGDTVTEAVAVDWSLTSAERMVGAGNSFVAIGFISRVDRDQGTVSYATRLLPWTTAYRFGIVEKAAGSQPAAVRNPVGFVVVSDATVANGEHLFRYDGARWQQARTPQPVAGPRYTYAYDADAAYATTVTDAGSWTSELFEFSPYTNAWQPPMHTGGAGPGLPVLGGGYRTEGRRVLRREPDGTWVDAATLPADADLTTLANHAPEYLSYQDSAGATHVLTLADGSIGDATALAGEHFVVAATQPGQVLAGPGCLVTYQGPSFDTAAAVNLYRIVGGQLTGRLAARPVTTVHSDDGYTDNDTTVTYDDATATYDPYGLVAQFVTVKVTPGDGTHGTLERVFFNGLSPSVPGVVYPPSDEYTNARDYFSQLNGQLFRTRGYTGDGRLASQTVNFPYTYSGDDLDQPIAGTYTRIRRQIERGTAEAFTADVRLAADLDHGRLPDALAQQFAAAGLPLRAPVTVVVDEPSGRWELLDAAGTSYPVASDGLQLLVHAWLENSTEFEYNERGQLSRKISHDLDDTGATRDLHTDTTYAWQVYPDMATANCLDPVAQRTTTDATAGVVTSSAVTTYTNAWGPWAAQHEYAWRGTTSAPQFEVWAAGEPADEWLRVRSVLAVTAHGQPLSAADESGHVAGIIYDRDRRFAVANTVNADPNAGEATYYGFEDYETPGGWRLTPDGLDPARYIGDGDAHTGHRALLLPPGADRAVGITTDLTPRRDGLTYLLSCWVKTGDGFVSDPKLTAWTITVHDQHGATASAVLTVAATDGDWQWIHQLVDPAALGVAALSTITLAFASRQPKADVWLDDIAFAPALGGLRATVYDRAGRELLDTVDLHGQTQRLGYDRLRRAVLDVAAGDVPRGMSAEWSWRTTHADFDPETPNAALHVAFRGSGAFTDFRQGGQWRRHWTAGAGWQQTPGRLSCAGAERLTWPAAADSAAFRFGFAADVTAPLRLSFGEGWTADWADGTWTLRSAQGEPLASTSAPAGTDLLLLLWPHRMALVVDGRLMLQQVAGAFIGPVTLGTDGPITLCWLAVGTDLVAGAAWLDNAGRQRQSQRIDDARVRVAATGYDQSGRAYLTSRSVELDGVAIGYRRALVADLDPATGAMGVCELTAAHPHDEGYPFQRVRFEPSPIGRPVEQGQPGRLFAIDLSVPAGQRHTTRYQYGVNTGEPLLPELPAGRYPVNTSADQDGNTVRTWLDRSGKVLAVADGDLTAALFTLTRHHYDVYGRPVRVEQPNAFDLGVADSAAFAVEHRYDATGNLIATTEPDLPGPVEYVYDRLGRLRFSWSPLGRADGYLCYRRYDELGRVTEEGTCDSEWDRANLEQHADDGDWLPAPGRWRRQYRYDGDGTDPRLLGRLWQTSSGDGEPGVQTTFAYTVEGLVATRTISVEAYDARPHTIAYEYDGIGATTAITYDAQFLARYRSNGFNEVVAVDGEHDGRTTPLARFAYHPDGALAGEVMAPGAGGELTRDYTYTPPGRLAGIADRFVTETTDYDSGGSYSGRAARVSARFTGVDGPGFVPQHEYRYSYDALGRLLEAESSVAEQYTVSGLTYDANGNQLTRGDTERFTYDEGTNRLTERSGERYAYDADGNLVAASDPVLRQLDYDPVSSQVTGMSTAAGDLRLEYTSDNVLAHRTGPDGRILYVPGTDGRPLMLHRADARGGTSIGCLIPGPGGVVAVWSPDGISYVLRGRLGSTLGLYDGSRMTGAFNYLPYGGFLGAPVDDGATAAYPYLFTGAERDPATGLYLFPARLYDPASGRFLSTDPAAQYPSPYLYAGGDPVNSFDPTGTFAFSWQSFLAASGGLYFVGAGIAATVVAGIIASALTGGLATGVLVLGGLVGGALLGAGIGSATYGFMHADASKQKFDSVEWGISVGLGAAFGAAAAGIGFAMVPLGLGAGATVLAETVIGAGLGSLDGVITNGSINAYHDVAFGQGAGTAAWQGAIGGAIGGALGGVLGRGLMYRNNLLIQAGKNSGSTFAHVVEEFDPVIWHSVIGTKRGAGRYSLADLTIDDPADLTLGRIIRGGQDTAVSVVNKPAVWNPNYFRSAAEIELPDANIVKVRAWVEGSKGNLKSFNILTNGCTSYARDAARAAGLQPPAWTLTATGLDLWLRTLGGTSF